MIVLITRGERTYDVGNVGKGFHFHMPRIRENVRAQTGNGDKCIVLLDGGLTYPEAVARHKKMCDAFGFDIRVEISRIPVAPASAVNARDLPNGVYVLGDRNYWLQKGDTIVEFGPKLCHIIDVLGPITFHPATEYLDVEPDLVELPDTVPDDAPVFVMQDEYHESFLEQVKQILEEKHPVTPPEPTNPQCEFAALRETMLPFGAFADVPLHSIPLSYLKWLHDNSRETVERLALYLKLFPQYEKTALEHKVRGHEPFRT